MTEFFGFVSGHGFSRAVESEMNFGALAPEEDGNGEREI
jgi:hypothetical protein